MDFSDAILSDILKNRYQEHREKADEARSGGEYETAATHLRSAATALSKLDEKTDEDYTSQVETLRKAAEKLDEGTDPIADSVTNGTSVESGGSGRRETKAQQEDQQSQDEDLRSNVESFIAQTEVKWNDVGGLHDVKTALKRSVALGTIPNKPDAVAASDRILLFGPPGTGKTLLASAVAGSLDATFFDVKIGGLLSKYLGQSSKQIQALFDLAAELSPSVIFLDEIDALTQSRDSNLDESSRRVLNTLLSELDGLDKGADEFTLVIGATNTPWDLDQAIRRRFPQRIHIPLPDRKAAAEIVRIHTVDGDVSFAGDPVAYAPDGTVQVSSPETAVARTCVERGFSGSDIAAVCREAVNRMVTRTNPNLESLVDEGVESLRNHRIETESVRPADFEYALDAVSASLSENDISRFDTWDDQFGSSL